MLKIFLPYKLLNSMYCEERNKPKEEWRPWLKILSRQSKIYYSKESDDSIDINSPFFVFTKNYDIKPVDATAEITAIKNDPRLGLKEASPVFLLDIDEATAKEIQEKYGYICQSQNSLDDSILTIEPLSLSPEKGNQGYSWSELQKFKKVPCNAITIIDRNLFATEKECKETAVDNIAEILSNLLPISLEKDVEFYITLIIDYNAIKYGYTFETIAKKMSEELKDKIITTFPIIFELIGIDRASDGSQFEKTHNRRIFSNYLFVTLDHQINAFYKNKALKTQTIEVKTLYSSGLVYGDATVKPHSKIIKDISELKQFGEEHRTTYKVAINGKSENKSFNDWNNRLFKILV